MSYVSKNLKVVALSSAEAEYAAASYACKEIEFIRSLCSDLGFPLTGKLVLAVDNEAAIAIAENQGVTAKNKHFRDAIHYVRHQTDHERIILKFVGTDEQRADGFTKPLSKTLYSNWLKMLPLSSGH